MPADPIPVPIPVPAPAPEPAPTKKMVKVKDIRPGNKMPCPGHVVEKVTLEANTVTIMTDHGEEHFDLSGDPATEVIS